LRREKGKKSLGIGEEREGRKSEILYGVVGAATCAREGKEGGKGEKKVV